VPPLKTYRDCQAYLYGRINYERLPDVPYTKNHFKLDRMRELARRLGDPQAGLVFVHVAGTKGKGSTAAMLAAMLTGAGYRTGLFTSPHLTRLEERFRIDGRPVSPRGLVGLVQAVAPEVDRMSAEGEAAFCRPTYFETLTAMALVHFARRKVDVAVLETGLGGRLDSTNIVMPAATIITSISHDHTKQLGTTLAAIAAEKAGIIKPGVPVVSGVLRPTPRRVIRHHCRDLDAPLVELGIDLHHQYEPAPSANGRLPRAAVSVETPGRRWSRLPQKLLGEHQAANCALAVAALDVLAERGISVSRSAAAKGLRAMDWPARMEVLGRRPLVIVDGAHNPASIETLCRTLSEHFMACKRILIFGAAGEKDVAAMLRTLVPRFDWIVTSRSGNPRAAEAEHLAAVARRLGHPRVLVEPRPTHAYRLARTLARPNDLILATGSFILAGEVREAALKGERHA